MVGMIWRFLRSSTILLPAMFIQTHFSQYYNVPVFSENPPYVPIFIFTATEKPVVDIQPIIGISVLT